MADAETVVVLNPVSGGGDATDEIRRRADERGFAVRETEAPGDGVARAREAVGAGATRVVAAGGDGTVNEVVRGVAAADALDHVTVGVVPAGTGNNFASNVGVESVSGAFDLLDDGPVRRLDLGLGGDRVFVNSCVGGLTAAASERTTPELKDRWGVLAYVIATMRTLAEFDALPMTVETLPADGGREVWSGDAALVLVGNARRFGVRRVSQADVEDGHLEVSIVTGAPAGDLLDAAASGALLGADAGYVHRRRTPGIDVTVHDGTAGFSFDGEIADLGDLRLRTRGGALAMHVGEGYAPDPERWFVSE